MAATVNRKSFPPPPPPPPPSRTQWLVPNFSFVVEYKGHVTWNDWIFHVGITGIWQLKQKPAITEESLATRKITTVVHYRTVKRSIAREKWEKRKEKKKKKVKKRKEKNRIEKKENTRKEERKQNRKQRKEKKKQKKKTKERETDGTKNK